MASKKIKNDKYYTSPELAKYCVEKTKEIIGEENITEWIEPSGGNGVFLDYLPEGTYSCDIEPEDSRVEKQDYLDYYSSYKEGRCTIGNPPFGSRNTLSVKFFKKSIKHSQYIAFILPISQLNNNQQMYEFNLVYSEDLGKREYSDRKVHCCFNIYEKPKSGIFNKKPNYKLNDFHIIENRLGNNRIEEYDARLLAWGTATNNRPLGCFLTKDDREYSKEFFVICNNKNLKQKILFELKNAHWEDIYPMTATPNLLQWQVYKYLKEQIPELE